MTAATQSKIEWTDTTWNPVTGCNKVSPGCKNCYAERMSKRLQAMGVRKYEDGFDVKLHPDTLEHPLKWKQPRRIFVNSMSDLFHEAIPDDFILQVFDVMNETPQHSYQVLTKRPERVADLDANNLLNWSPNIWMGTSVENDAYIKRIDSLRFTGAHIKFLSLEPLLGPLPNLKLKDIHWVIVGGESGPKARLNKEILEDWVRDIRDQCISADVPFFFKQWGGRFKKRTGRELDERTWDEYPAQVQV